MAVKKKQKKPAASAGGSPAPVTQEYEVLKPVRLEGEGWVNEGTVHLHPRQASFLVTAGRLRLKVSQETGVQP